ncbi:DUF3995 domain-containing protein [Streptomyces sp. NPDC058382]|uniref:DUF3995 domain-containing protein n=1 Tax=unclassified Streptomyces TaxID=2593676 RepID=UPI00364264AE
MTALDREPMGQTVGNADEGKRSRNIYLTVAFTLLYMGLHVYWAVGGTWGVPLAALQNADAVRKANWVVSGIMLIGAAWVFALDHRFSRRVPAWAVLAPLWCGAVVCASHAVFGFVTKTLYLAGVHDAVDFPDATGVSGAALAQDHHVSAVRDLWVFEPCFLIQGLLLALVGRQFIRTPGGRRTWSLSLLVGVAVVDVFGLFLALGNAHFAVG